MDEIAAGVVAGHHKAIVDKVTNDLEEALELIVRRKHREAGSRLQYVIKDLEKAAILQDVLSDVREVARKVKKDAKHG